MPDWQNLLWWSVQISVHALNKRHTEINITSWRKQILETNGDWELWLMSAKGWNSYWYGLHRPVGWEEVTGCLDSLPPLNGSLSTELGRSVCDLHVTRRHRVCECAHWNKCVCTGACTHALFTCVTVGILVSERSLGILVRINSKLLVVQ